MAGAAVDICCSFLYAVLHPEIRICGGHCRPQCGAGSDTPEDASRMAQALYDAADPVGRSAAEPEQKLHEYGKAKPTGWNSIQPVGFVVLAN